MASCYMAIVLVETVFNCVDLIWRKGGFLFEGSFRPAKGSGNIASSSRAFSPKLAVRHYPRLRHADVPRECSLVGALARRTSHAPVRRQRSRRFAWRQRELTNLFATRPTQPGVPRDGVRFLRRENQTSSLAVRLSLEESQTSGRLKSYSWAQSIHA